MSAVIRTAGVVSQFQSSASNSWSLEGTLVEGDQLLVLVVVNSGRAVSSIAWNGDALTLVADAWPGTGSTPDPKLRAYFMDAPDIGTFNLTMTTTGTDSGSWAIVPVSGVDPTTPVTSIQKVENSTTNPDGVTVTSNIDSIVFGLMRITHSGGNDGSDPPVGMTMIREDEISSRDYHIGYIAGAASVELEWSTTELTAWGILGFSLNAAESGGPIEESVDADADVDFIPSVIADMGDDQTEDVTPEISLLGLLGENLALIDFDVLPAFAVEGEVDSRKVFINTSASDTGRQVHPFVNWTDTAIELAAISKQGLSGSTFYWKVRNSDGLESEWFGPVTINDSGVQEASVSFSLTPDLVASALAVIEAVANLTSTFTININGAADLLADLLADAEMNLELAEESGINEALTFDIGNGHLAAADVSYLLDVAANFAAAVAVAATEDAQLAIALEQALAEAMQSPLDASGAVSLAQVLGFDTDSTVTQNEVDASLLVNVLPQFTNAAVAALLADVEATVTALTTLQGAAETDASVSIASALAAILDGVSFGDDEAQIGFDMTQQVAFADVAELLASLNVNVNAVELATATQVMFALNSLGFTITDARVGDSGADETISFSSDVGFSSVEEYVAEASLLVPVIQALVAEVRADLLEQLMNDAGFGASSSTIGTMNDNVAISTSLTYTATGAVVGVVLVLKNGRIINVDGQSRLLNLASQDRLINTGDR